jgi:hypothetical protein
MLGDHVPAVSFDYHRERLESYTYIIQNIYKY